MSSPVISPWCFRIELFADESFSHFLGRFRRANALSHRTLAQMLSSETLEILPSHIQAWERPSQRLMPGEFQLQRLSELCQVEVSQFQMALSPLNRPLHLPIRLCSHCYRHAPIHRLSWQYADRKDCAEHHCSLLSACPVCQTPFRVPSLWDKGGCERCWLPFAQMADYV